MIFRRRHEHRYAAALEGFVETESLRVHSVGTGYEDRVEECGDVALLLEGARVIPVLEELCVVVAGDVKEGFEKVFAAIPVRAEEGPGEVTKREFGSFEERILGAFVESPVKAERNGRDLGGEILTDIEAEYLLACGQVIEFDIILGLLVTQMENTEFGPVAIPFLQHGDGLGKMRALDNYNRAIGGWGVLGSDLVDGECTGASEEVLEPFALVEL